MVSEITEINGVYKLRLPTPFSVGPINVYLIKGEALTLVDTGPKTTEAWAVLCKLLRELNLTPEDIDQVVLTHHHPDHVGLLDYMKHQKKIVGHWKNNPWIGLESSFITKHDTFYINYFKVLGVEEWMYIPVLDKMKRPFTYGCSKQKVTDELKDKDVLPGLDGWKVFETPGHAGSHIILLREKDGLMLAGDLIIEHISSNPFIEPPYDGETERAKSLLQYHDSLRKCLELDSSLVLSGHGKNIENVQSLIHSRLEKQEERANRVFEWLKEKPLTALEVSEKLYPVLYKKQLTLTISATVGQLDYLEEKNAIEIDKTNDVWKYLVR